MTELGEGISLAVDKKATEKKGKLVVIVKDECNDEGIEGVEVTVAGKTRKTNDKGESSFTALSVGLKSVEVKIHFRDVDYATFIIQYPRVLNNHEAKSSGNDLVEIEPDAEALSEIELRVYKTVGDIVFHRRHIDPGGEDKYGHWWTVVDSSTSFGWWPKYALGSAMNRSSDPPEPPAPLPADASTTQKIQHMFSSVIYAVKNKTYQIRGSSPVQTLAGVEGELNGQASFGGTPKMDPHHMMGDEGDEQYQPVRWDCFNLGEIKAEISTFAKDYSGGWSWRFEGGNHCHTFQIKLMKDSRLNNVKVLK